MSKKNILAFTLAAAVFSLPGLAAAANYSAAVGFDSYSAHIGGMNSSIPGGYLHTRERFGKIALSQRFFGGSSGSIHGDLLAGSLHAGYLIHPEPHLTVMPYLGAGYIHIAPMGSHINTAYADAGIRVNDQVFRNIGIYGKGGFGRNFGTAIAGVPTTGGLFYTAAVGVDAKVGPGDFSMGYQYQSMPFGHGLNLGTDQYRVGYRLPF